MNLDKFQFDQDHFKRVKDNRYSDKAIQIGN